MEQYEEIIKTIRYLIEKELTKAPFNYLLDGVIKEKTGDLTYTVLIANKEYYNIEPMNINDSYAVDDIVYVLVRNNDFSDKKILGSKGLSKSKGGIDKNNLPDYPVHIIRENGETGRAFRFNYGFENYPLEYRWSQVLHRNDRGQVIMISNHYYDNTVDFFHLLRNSSDRVYYYGKNPDFIEE